MTPEERAEKLWKNFGYFAPSERQLFIEAIRALATEQHFSTQGLNPRQSATDQ